MINKIIPFAFLVFITLASCGDKNRFQVDVSQANIDIPTHRFDRDLHLTDTVDVEKGIELLKLKYGPFYELFSSRIISIGPSNHPNHAIYFRRFLTDSIFRQVNDTVQLIFHSTEGIENDIVDGLKRFHILFPEKSLPEVYFHMSGFNESVVVAENILSVSLENYLGSEHPFYDWLGVYEYKKAQKIPERIAPDALKGWLMTEFGQDKNQTRLIDEMMYEGKLAFILQQLLPDISENLLMGQTPEQFKWCKEHEEKIWTAMIEWKHLFSKDRITIKKHLDDAPFNNFFGEGSAPKSGIYIGWRIVSEYMQKNKDASLKDMFEISDGQEFLQKAAYRP